MGRPRSKNSVYFIEDEMVEVLKEYRFTKSEKVFEKIEPKIVAIINGMINKEFSPIYLGDEPKVALTINEWFTAWCPLPEVGR